MAQETKLKHWTSLAKFWFVVLSLGCKTVDPWKWAPILQFLAKKQKEWLIERTTLAPFPNHLKLGHDAPSIMWSRRQSKARPLINVWLNRSKCQPHYCRLSSLCCIVCNCWVCSIEPNQTLSLHILMCSVSLLSTNQWIVCNIRPIKSWSVLVLQPISSVTRQRSVLTLQWQQNKWNLETLPTVKPMYVAIQKRCY